MKITEHFDSNEFKQPAKWGLSELSYPQIWITERLLPLCIQLELIREKLGGLPIHIVSGYRSPEYNLIIGGAKKSQHLEGRAADIVVKDMDAKIVHDSILQMYNAKVITIGGLGRYNTFTHVDTRLSQDLITWGGRAVDG